MEKENNYGSLIKQERENAKMSQEELAGILLMTPESLSYVENEQAILSEFRLNMVANTFNISKKELLNGTIISQPRYSEIVTMLSKIEDDIEKMKETQRKIQDKLSDEKNMEDTLVDTSMEEVEEYQLKM